MTNTVLWTAILHRSKKSTIVGVFSSEDIAYENIREYLEELSEKETINNYDIRVDPFNLDEREILTIESL